MLHSIDAVGRLLSVSDEWLSHMGYLRDEVVGRQYTEFLTPDSRQTVQERILPELLRTGRCDEVERRMVHCNGTIIDVRLSATLERHRDRFLVDPKKMSKLTTDFVRPAVLPQTALLQRSTGDIVSRGSEQPPPASSARFTTLQRN